MLRIFACGARPIGPMGLLPVDHGLYAIYFAQLPPIGFDARSYKLLPIGNSGLGKSTFSGGGQACPPPESRNKNLPDKENCRRCARSKMSEMCPAIHLWIPMAHPGEGRKFPLRLQFP